MSEVTTVPMVALPSVSASALPSHRKSARNPGSISVRIPDLPHIDPKYRGTTHTVGGNTSLYGRSGSNVKIAKNDKSGIYRSWGLSLAPSLSSGYQVCASASAGCIASCLYHQGHARVFSTINIGRIARTIAFFEEREWFLERLQWETANIARTAKRLEVTPVVRLNVMSDILWESVCPALFSDNPGIQFYDYTKHAIRAMRFANGELPANYDITFSRSETNHIEVFRVLKARGKVAMVFRTKDAIPAMWCGFPVVEGDSTDLRFLDKPGHVIALFAKGTAKKDTSGFVTDGRVSLPTV